MKTWIATMIVGLVLAVGGCDSKESGDGKADDKKEQPAEGADTKKEDAGANKDEAAAKEVPTEEDFETAAANDITKDSLEKNVKELEDELGDDDQ